MLLVPKLIRMNYLGGRQDSQEQGIDTGKVDISSLISGFVFHATFATNFGGLWFSPAVLAPAMTSMLRSSRN